MDLNKSNYQAWLIDESDFPKNGTIEAQINFLIRYGVLAPSTHNSQPWLFTVDGSYLKVSPNWHKKLLQADPTGRNLIISLGACAFNIIVAAAHFGFETSLEYQGSLPEDSYVTIGFTYTKKPDQNLAQLFPQITRRYSDKRVLQNKKIDNQIVQKLQDLSGKYAQVNITTNKKAIDELAILGLKASASYAQEPLFSRELSSWLRSNKTSKTDGMPGFSGGLSNPKAVTGKAITKVQPKFLKVMAKKYLQMLQTSPAVGTVTSKSDTWEDWFKAGLGYEQLALVATAHNISLSPVSALIERPERGLLKKYFSHMTGQPQMFFRLAHVSNEALHTPRRVQTRITSERTLIENIKKTTPEVSAHSLTVNAYHINYIEAGKGDPLLLIHGANIGWGQWHANISELAKHFRVIALDLPGAGGSSTKDFRSLEFETDYVKTVADFIKLRKLKNVSIIGHSFGGAIALKLAQDSDLMINKIVLVSPLGFTRQVPGKQKIITIYPLARLISSTAVKPNKPNMEKFLAEPLQNKDAITEDLANYYWSAIAENKSRHPLRFMNSLTTTFAIKKELLLTEDLHKISQPVLVIVGDSDPLTPIPRVRTGLKNLTKSQLEIFTNTGHVPSLEKSKEFNKLVIKFLS